MHKLNTTHIKLLRKASGNVESIAIKFVMVLIKSMLEQREGGFCSVRLPNMNINWSRKVKSCTAELKIKLSYSAFSGF